MKTTTLQLLLAAKRSLSRLWSRGIESVQETFVSSLDVAGEPLSAFPPLPMVLHVRVVSGPGGGPDKTILRCPRFTDANRYRMAAAFLYPKNDPGIQVIRQNAQRWHCPIHLIPEFGPFDPRSIFRLLALCRRLHVTIWHAHDYKSNLLGLILRRWWPMKLVTTVHGWTCDNRRSRLYYALDRWLLRFYDQVIVVSPVLAHSCFEHGVPWQKLTYIPNAIDAGDFQRRGSRAQARAALGIAADRFVIGLIGRLSPEKGIDRAMQSLAVLRGEFPKAELHVIGDGPQRQELEDTVLRHGLGESVRFWGWQPDVRGHLEAMDLLLSSSYQEAAANVILEAMAMEVPVAATNVGSASEMLQQGKCGLILAQRCHLWPSQLTTVMRDPVLAKTLAARARKRVETAYSFHRRMNRVMAIYDQVLRLEKFLVGGQVNATWPDVAETVPLRRAA
ncbi:MAG: glycosyltransferase [Phycisphaeraceae bacterium]|nr:glycosyltransferase [Phycisphaeraceae bacterium]